MAKEDVVELDGKVIEVLPGGHYKVELENKHIITAYTSGKMYAHKIRISLGDKVTIELSLYDLTNGRITYRK